MHISKQTVSPWIEVKFLGFEVEDKFIVGYITIKNIAICLLLVKLAYKKIAP